LLIIFERVIWQIQTSLELKTNNQSSASFLLILQNRALCSAEVIVRIEHPKLRLGATIERFFEATGLTPCPLLFSLYSKRGEILEIKIEVENRTPAFNSIKAFPSLPVERGQACLPKGCIHLKGGVSLKCES